MAKPDYAQIGRWAREFITERYAANGVPTLYYWRGSFWWWNGRRFVEDPDTKGRSCWIERRVRDWMRERGVGEHDSPELVRKDLAALVEFQWEAAMPCWVGAKDDPERPEPGHLMMAFNNGMVDVTEWLATGSPRIRPHTPKWFDARVLPYGADPKAGCPRWLQFLDRVMEGDQERIELIRQWFGYCLQPSTQAQAFMVWSGSGANGKTVALEVLRHLVGPAFCSEVPLHRMHRQFALASLVDKLVNLGNESGLLAKEAEDIFKAVVEGKGINIDRKYRDALDGVCLPTKFMFAMNTEPRFTDPTDGTWRKLLLVHWGVSIPKAEQDTTLVASEKIDWPFRAELPGIFNWAIRGLKTLSDNGWRFTVPDSCQDYAEECRRESDAVSMFLADRCFVGDGGSVTTSFLFDQYSLYCQEHGYERLPDNAFGRRVLGQAGVRRSRRMVSGVRIYYYDGIRLVSEGVKS